MPAVKIQYPSDGDRITIIDQQLQVPDHPIIPFIMGDGIGSDLWGAARPVLDGAVRLAYSGHRQLCWVVVPAGQESLHHHGDLLPDETIAAFRDCHVGIKGPLSTPVGGGFRSINVRLRQELDLYICMRPIRWIPGVPSPVRKPQNVDMVVFRENTEDIYAGIEFSSGSPSAADFLAWLRETHPDDFKKIRFPDNPGIGIKPISPEGSQRLVRAAIQYALDFNRRSVTLVHKGNIMKFTEGAFAEWGYDLAEREFGEKVYTQRQYNATKESSGEAAANSEYEAALDQGRLYVNDAITDASLVQTMTRPETFDVIATMNLNGDYLSDALAAQVGGLGIAPGANLNEETKVAVFEAIHGTAPRMAGKNTANPSSLILSGEMMLRYLGWHEAADLVWTGIQGAVSAKTVTTDFHRQMPDSQLVSTTGFGEAILDHMTGAAGS